MKASNDLKLFVSNEIMGAYMTEKLQGSERKEFAKNPKAYLLSTFNIDLTDSIDCRTVANDEKTVNLALPYYEVINDMHASKVADDQMGELAGGEFFFIALPTLLGFGIGFSVAVPFIGVTGTAVAAGVAVGAAAGVTGAVVATAGAVGTAAVVERNKGKNLNGSSK